MQVFACGFPSTLYLSWYILIRHSLLLTLYGSFLHWRSFFFLYFSIFVFHLPACSLFNFITPHLANTSTSFPSRTLPMFSLSAIGIHPDRIQSFFSFSPIKTFFCYIEIYKIPRNLRNPHSFYIYLFMLCFCGLPVLT